MNPRFRLFPILLSAFASLSLVPSAFPATLQVPDDHPTIQKAIDASKPGDIISVATGTYKERVTLKPNLTLRSKGDDSKGKLGLKRAEETIIDAGGAIADDDHEAAPGVAMAEGAILDGFTVTNAGLYDDALWKKHHATRGNEQKHEHIGAFGAPGIGADGVTCTIRNNIVHHNGHTGIAIRGAIEKNVAPLVTNNVTYRNMGGGIGIMAGALGIIEGNTCFENFYAGIGHSGASPLVINNTCYQNIRAGIGVSEGACPVVRSNKCYQNRRAGIGTRTGIGTAPVIEDNDCYENGMAGIGTDEGASPLIRGNRCLNNEMAGIGARDGSHPIIIGNVCKGNKAAALGFEACEGGTALVRGNTIEATTVVAIGIQSGWKVTLTDNEIRGGDGMPPAVMVFENSSATFSGNTITGGGVAGIRVAGTLIASGNKFLGTTLRKVGPPNFAVWALEGASVSLSANHMRSWRHALSATAATVTATHNHAEIFHRAAFVVTRPSSPATLVGNTAISGDPAAVAVSLKDDPGNKSVAELNVLEKAPAENK
jgi:parallel beta-helix repeat protein